MTEPEQDNPVLVWANAHPVESQAIAGKYVAVTLAGVLLDRDASFEQLYTRWAGEDGVVIGRVGQEAERAAKVAAVFESKPWKSVARRTIPPAGPRSQSYGR